MTAREWDIVVFDMVTIQCYVVVGSQKKKLFDLIALIFRFSAAMRGIFEMLRLKGLV